MTLTHRPGSVIGRIVRTTAIVIVVLSLLCLCINNATAAKSGNHHIPGWISRLIDTNVYNNYPPIVKPSVQPTIPPVPTTTPETPPVTNSTPPATPTPTPSQVSTPIPPVASPPSAANNNPCSIASIYGTPTPDPVKGHAAPAAAKPDSTTANKTVAWAISGISTMADLPLVNGAGSGAAASHSVSDAVPLKNGFSDLLMMVNILIPILAIGLILYDQSRVK